MAAQEPFVGQRRPHHAQLRARPHIRDEALQRLVQAAGSSKTAQQHTACMSTLACT